MALTTPRFQIGDIAYIVASAAGRGFLESYTIDGISLNKETNIWWYTINVARPPSAGVIVGDRAQLVKERILYFSEPELTDYCTALGLCSDYLTRAMANINTKLAACEEEEDTGGTA